MDEACHADGDTWDAVDTAFHCAGDGAGIGDIEAEVGAVVDAAKDEVAFVIGEDFSESDVDTIDGETVDHISGASFDFKFFDS